MLKYMIVLKRLSAFFLFKIHSYLTQYSKNLTAVGFEPTPVYTDQNSHYRNVSYLKLESGALDRSAILSYILYYLHFVLKMKHDIFIRSSKSLLNFFKCFTKYYPIIII